MERKLKLISMSDNKPLDARTVRFFKSLSETRKKLTQENFQEWLNICNEDNVPNVNFVRWFIDDIMEVLNHYNYEIANEKRFKDEIASFIYKLSNHNA